MSAVAVTKTAVPIPTQPTLALPRLENPLANQQLMPETKPQLAPESRQKLALAVTRVATQVTTQVTTNTVPVREQAMPDALRRALVVVALQLAAAERAVMRPAE
ncbi:MAG: hypothetical protein RL701_6128 [Pseudomonadota bacterium]